MKELLKKFARYEITVNDLPDKYKNNAINIDPNDDVIKVEYQINLDDLIAVLDKIEKDNISIGQYDDEWALGFYEYGIGDFLGLDKAMGVEGEIPMRNNALPECDEDLFRIVFEYMDMPVFMDEDEPAVQVLDIDTIRAIIAAYNSNKDKPITEWEYPDDLKEAFVYEIEGMINNHLHCSDDYIDLFVRFTEELASKGNEGVLEVLGYQYYGGTKAFACDWFRARDIFEDLFEKTGNPGYANTLGYIYYYGRCNDGKPEDDKAYRYFSYGNAAGLFESTYKLADMIRQGRAVPKNRDVAMSMVSRIYSENRELFESGLFDCKFADVALRMGDFYEDRTIGEDGKEEMTDPLAAYAYYLQAQLAINFRIEDGDYYGDDVVAINVKKALDRVRPSIKFVDKDFFVEDEPGLIEACIKPESYIYAKFAKTGKGMKVTAKKCNGDSFLITFPEFDYCDLKESIEMYGANVEFIEEPDYEREYCITSIEVLYENDGVHVAFYDSEPVAEVKCNEWIYRFDREPVAEDDKEYRIATVTFEEGGKGYDYICEFDQVKPGDTAFVETGIEGEKKVVVVKNVRIVKGSELPMPISKYKKLLAMVLL